MAVSLWGPGVEYGGLKENGSKGSDIIRMCGLVEGHVSWWMWALRALFLNTKTLPFHNEKRTYADFFPMLLALQCLLIRYIIDTSEYHW